MKLDASFESTPGDDRPGRCRLGDRRGVGVRTLEHSQCLWMEIKRSFS